MAREAKSDRLYLRVSERQRQVIGEAAEATDKDLTSFVLDAALVEAQRIVTDRRVFQVDAAGWDDLIRRLEEPPALPSAKPRLEKLLREPSVLER